MKKLFFTTAALCAVLTGPAFAESITKEEVQAAQQNWADGVVNIGSVYSEDGDYEAAARAHLDTLYAYDMGPVLFKPTLASDDQFRMSYDEALSYFVGGSISEDKGFAIKPWTNVRFENSETLVDEDSALAMGNYFFTPADGGDDVKVEYSFGYIKDEEGNVKINLHHSSIPFTPE